ncbi:DUF3618 domain-containing protein [Streptosporangium sp. NPDC051022]|uniref:DUF3618 domain-containing protein n=1 Tax=Streptosporangium sp. NPDC051022 TaxID=3155752 RepID=UPI00341B5C09
MTETDPERPDDTLDAGTTGARRREAAEPVQPDEEMSLNLPPKVPGEAPSPAPGVPPPGREETPRPAERTAGAAGRAPAPAAPSPAAPAAAASTATGPATAASAAGGTAVAAGTAGHPRGTSRGGGGTSEESVRRDIENDRRELGDTVEALVHKTDVKGRVQETAAQMGDELRRVGAATATTATEMADRVKEAAPEMVGRVREAAPEVVGRVKEATPAEVREAAGRVTTEIAKRPVAVVAAGAVLVLVAVRLLRRGRRSTKRR